MKNQTDDPTYAARMQAMYDSSNEKALLKEKLAEALRGRRLKRALDVGPGPGEVTQILAELTDDLTLIEITPTFEAGLKKRFPGAKLIIDSINNVPLAGPYDVILYSQALYYQPEADWFKVCKRLHESLAPGGQLILVMNTDRGDYWDLVRHCWKERPELKTFYLKAWSEFKRELERLGEIKVYPMRYGAVCTEVSFDDYVGGGLLAIPDRESYVRNRPFIHDFCQRFRQPEGRYRFEIDCELLTIGKN